MKSNKLHLPKPRTAIATLLALLFLVAASPETETTRPSRPPAKLSEFGFFTGPIAAQLPAADLLPYALNTPLFSDYADKIRFVRIPKGTSAVYHPDSVWRFPAGAALIKTFYYPLDARNPAKGRRLVETRVLLRDSLKGWIALPYVWNDEQTDAFLEVAGDAKTIARTDIDGKTTIHRYLIPNVNQCKGCHNQSEKMTPIGPTARQLNGDFPYASGSRNQIAHWQELGLLTGLDDPRKAPRLPRWDDPATGSLDSRARAYLDINCAHCHNPQGPARTSGMFLSVFTRDSTALGIYKSPVAAGRGSGNRRFGIVPGKPNESILVYRMESTDPGVLMPELGRSMVHREGLQLIKEWIRNMQ